MRIEIHLFRFYSLYLGLIRSRHQSLLFKYWEGVWEKTTKSSSWWISRTGSTCFCQRRKFICLKWRSQTTSKHQKWTHHRSCEGSDGRAVVIGKWFYGGGSGATGGGGKREEKLHIHGLGFREWQYHHIMWGTNIWNLSYTYMHALHKLNRIIYHAHSKISNTY